MNNKTTYDDPVNATGETPAYEEIAILAYQYWEEGGRADGTAEADWYRAEADLKARPRSVLAADLPKTGIAAGA